MWSVTPPLGRKPWVAASVRVSDSDDDWQSLEVTALAGFARGRSVTVGPTVPVVPSESLRPPTDVPDQPTRRGPVLTWAPGTRDDGWVSC